MNKSGTTTLRTLLIICLAALAAMGSVSTDIYLPATLKIAEDFQSDMGKVQLSIAIFFLAYGFGQLILGPLSDSLGRKPVLLTGLYLYMVSSIGCSTSTNVDQLIIWRFFQALGACTAAVVSRSIIKDLTQGIDTARAISSVSAISQAGPILAPAIGGLIVSLSSWNATFHALTIYGVITVIGTHVLITETHPENQRQPLSLSHICIGYVQIVTTNKMYVLLIAEISIALVLFTFVAGSSLILIDGYGLSPKNFGLAFSVMSTALLSGGYINNKVVGFLGINKTTRFYLVFTIVATFIFFIFCKTQPSLLVFLISLWFCLLPNAAIRANYLSIGLETVPDRSGSVAAVFGAFSLGTGGMIAALIGRLNQFDAVVFSLVLLFGYAVSAVMFSIWLHTPDNGP